MNALMMICGVLSLVVLLVVLGPFFYGEGGLLQDASVSDNLEELRSRQAAILQRWLKDEAAALNGEVSQTEWRQRQRYLTSRYVDVARRIAWLSNQQDASSRERVG